MKILVLNCGSSSIKYKLFERHAVVMEESCNRNRRGHQQAEPACGFFSDDIS